MERRAKILAAAEQVIGEKGFNAASIADITRKAETALGTFYIYFSSKEPSDESRDLPPTADSGGILGANHRRLMQSFSKGSAVSSIDQMSASMEWPQEHPRHL